MNRNAYDLTLEYIDVLNDIEKLMLERVNLNVEERIDKVVEERQMRLTDLKNKLKSVTF